MAIANPIYTPEFMLHDLSHSQLADANKMIYKELERVHKNARCNDICGSCKQKKYCAWLHLVQLHILKKINEENTSSESGDTKVN